MFGLVTIALRTLIFGVISPASLGGPITFLIQNTVIGFLRYTAGGLVCAYLISAVSPHPETVKATPTNTLASRRRKIIALVVIVVISAVGVVFYPTSRVRSFSGTMTSIQFQDQSGSKITPQFLFGGQVVQKSISTSTPPSPVGPILFKTDVNIQSTENVSIAVVMEERPFSSGGQVVSQIYQCYNVTAKTHIASFQQPITSGNALITYTVIAKNPGLPLYMNGTVKVSLEFQYLEWTQWWKS
jgi:hypothetical protein